jgi:hypothetical protein
LASLFFFYKKGLTPASLRKHNCLQHHQLAEKGIGLAALHSLPDVSQPCRSYCGIKNGSTPLADLLTSFALEVFDELTR